VRVLRRVAARARAWSERRAGERVARQLPLVAQVLAAHLRAGRSLRQAVADAADDLPAPAAARMRHAAAAVGLGAPPGDALRLVADHADVRLLAAAVEIQARFGGDLAALLEDMSEVLHARAALVRSARVATAQARATGRIVSAMPLAGLAALALVDRPALGMLLGTWIGWLTLAASAGLTAGGQALVGRLARVDP
jgi:tight adherence protein B